MMGELGDNKNPNRPWNIEIDFLKNRKQKLNRLVFICQKTSKTIMENNGF